MSETTPEPVETPEPDDIPIPEPSEGETQDEEVPDGVHG